MYAHAHATVPAQVQVALADAAAAERAAVIVARPYPNYDAVRHTFGPVFADRLVGKPTSFRELVITYACLRKVKKQRPRYITVRPNGLVADVAVL